MVAVIDYGAGNIRSMVNAIIRVGQSVGIQVIVSSDIETLKEADKLILPGVGAFGDVIMNLKQKGIDKLVRDWIKKGKKFMGVCVGLQVLFEVGYENGTYEGIGIFKGEVVKFSKAEPIPHIGWNQIEIVNESNFFRNEDNGKFFYFVHSYYAIPKDTTIINTTTNYNGEVFTSSIFADNVFAVQFHPEKSHKNGEKVLKRFLLEF
ncbi:MAG: imidazole glycerol phosphate synthase subunit HisH [Brevinematales bacterium]|nr:imidazole glycerol phosphate synthase subunit HisH [Brevinematales bacterium]